MFEHGQKIREYLPWDMVIRMGFLPNLRRMTVIYHGYWGKIALSQIFALLMAAFMIFIPLQVSSIINDATNIHAAVENAVLIALFAVLCGVFCMANVVYSVRISEATGNYVRNGIYKKIQSYSFGNLDRFSTGELLTRLTSDIYQIKIHSPCHQHSSSWGLLRSSLYLQEVLRSSPGR
ncbi:MAG: ABC transporter transmembrane domain-containing protein [Methanobacteriota archaeon]